MKITKKYIISVLKTEDITKICALYAQIHGKCPATKIEIEECEVKMLRSTPIIGWMAKYFKEIGTRRARILSMKFLRVNHYQNVDYYGEKYKYKKHSFFDPLRKQYIVDAFKQEMERFGSPYQKVPTMGNTGLYFCSPNYGHYDYNKWRAIDIKGNEAFCDTIMSLYAKIAERHGINPNQQRMKRVKI